MSGLVLKFDRHRPLAARPVELPLPPEVLEILPQLRRLSIIRPGLIRAFGSLADTFFQGLDQKVGAKDGA